MMVMHCPKKTFKDFQSLCCIMKNTLLVYFKVWRIKSHVINVSLLHSVSFLTAFQQRESS